MNEEIKGSKTMLAISMLVAFVWLCAEFKDIRNEMSNVLVILLGGVATYGLQCKYVKTRSRTLLNAIPGVWTSLGLLGTFIAIVISLNNIDPEKIDVPIIINGLVPAFTTSIIGLIGAVVYTVWNKWIFANEDSQTEEALGGTPEEYIKQTAEGIDALDTTMQGVLVEIKEMRADGNVYQQWHRNALDNQNRRMKELDDRMCRFFDTFETNVVGVLDSMQQRIEKQMATMTDSSLSGMCELLRKVSEEMSNSLKTIVKEQHAGVANILDQSNRDVERFRAQLVESMKDMQKSISSTLEDMKRDQKANHKETIEQYNDMMTTLKETMSKMAKDTANEVGGCMAEAVGAIDEVGGNVINSFEEITKNVRSSVAEQCNTLDKVSDKMRESFVETAESIKASVGEQCDTLARSIRDNVSSLRGAYTFITNQMKYIEERMAEIKQNYDASVTAYSDAVDNVNKMNENTGEAILEARNGIDTMNKANITMERALTSIEQHDKNIEVITSRVKDMGEAIAQLQKLENQLNRLIANR